MILVSLLSFAVVHRTGFTSDYMYKVRVIKCSSTALDLAVSKCEFHCYIGGKWWNGEMNVPFKKSCLMHVI